MTKKDTLQAIGELVKSRVTDIQQHPHDFSSGKVQAKSLSGRKVKALQRQNESLSTKLTWLSELSYQENDIKWIWEGFLAKSHITLLSAAPKTGKTTLLLHFLLAQDTGKETFISYELRSVKTLILSEESANIWCGRREAHGISGELVALLPRVLHRRLLSSEWEDWISQVGTICLEQKIELVVFDTLASFWPVIDENGATNVTDAFKPFYDLTDKGLAVLLVHHERKNGGSFGVESRGSSALTASADILLSLKRPSDRELKNVRTLTGVSRFEETPEQLTIELKDNEYIVREGLSELQFEQNFHSILELIPFTPESTTIPDVVKKLDATEKAPTQITLWRWIKKASKKELIFSPGKSDAKGRPTLWSRKAIEVTEEAA